MELRFLKGNWEFGKYKLQVRASSEGDEGDWEDVPTVPTVEEPKKCEHRFVNDEGVHTNFCQKGCGYGLPKDWKEPKKEEKKSCCDYVNWQVDNFCCVCGKAKPKPEEKRKLWEILKYVIPTSGQFISDKPYHSQSQAVFADLEKRIDKFREADHGCLAGEKWILEDLKAFIRKEWLGE